MRQLVLRLYFGILEANSAVHHYSYHQLFLFLNLAGHKSTVYVLFLAAFDDSVDWQNPESILKKMQELSCPFDTTKPKLLSTYGAKFIHCQRESTIDTLWNGTEDRNGVLKRFEKHRQTDRRRAPHSISSWWSRNWQEPISYGS
ncbi:hypothetical protein BC937DRAFT_91616 [Endogone sp. FLAS-F59071]|nr:hypothetical protein BC937DRAFT_91616 [Endogone sp. FLAS-F59071]|eukprot:RUS16099.1 hypothetical protein BC937DRAFT_91616 [Endogone sp. FLAS-F59071]